MTTNELAKFIIDELKKIDVVSNLSNESKEILDTIDYFGWDFHDSVKEFENETSYMFSIIRPDNVIISGSSTSNNLEAIGKAYDAAIKLELAEMGF